MIMDRRQFEEIYEYINQRVSSFPDSDIDRMGEKNQRLLNKFLDYFRTENVNEMWDYFIFIFSSKCEMKTSQIIRLSWIIGSVAIKAWKQRTPEQMRKAIEWAYARKLFNPLTQAVIPLGEQYKEEQRSKWLNTSRGLLHCRDFGGELYEKKSESCIKCKYKQYCKNDV